MVDEGCLSLSTTPAIGRGKPVTRKAIAMAGLADILVRRIREKSVRAAHQAVALKEKRLN